MSKLNFKDLKGDYNIIAKDFDEIIFCKDKHIFSEQFLKEADSFWENNPGKYNSIIIGIKNIKLIDNKLYLYVIPMKYSWHRYITFCIKNNKKIDEEDKILPCCISAMSYITLNNKKNYIFGIKKLGNLSGGKLETIPQGFCDFKEDLSDYVKYITLKELHEEISLELSINNLKIVSLVTDNIDLQYSILLTFEIVEKDVVISKCSKSERLDEHETLFLISENDLKQLYNNPSDYISKFLIKPQKIEIVPTSKALIVFNQSF